MIALPQMILDLLAETLEVEVVCHSITQCCDHLSVHIEVLLHSFHMTHLFAVRYKEIHLGPLRHRGKWPACPSSSYWVLRDVGLSLGLIMVIQGAHKPIAHSL